MLIRVRPCLPMNTAARSNRRLRLRGLRIAHSIATAPATFARAGNSDRRAGMIGSAQTGHAGRMGMEIASLVVADHVRWHRRGRLKVAVSMRRGLAPTGVPVARARDADFDRSQGLNAMNMRAPKSGLFRSSGKANAREEIAQGVNVHEEISALIVKIALSARRCCQGIRISETTVRARSYESLRPWLVARG